MGLVKMASVNFVRADVKAYLPIWKQIRDCIAGSVAVKAARTKYLPQPNADDTSKENEARYTQYRERAMFYGATSRTLAGMVGQVFDVPPLVTLPPPLAIMETDATGGGVSLDQFAKQALAGGVAFGRCGILTDYPTLDGPATVAQTQSGDVRPFFKFYDPEDIINWRKVTINGRVLLGLIVLIEKYVESDDGFEAKEAEQFRVLRLGYPDPNNPDYFTAPPVYIVEIWRSMGGDFAPIARFIPTQASGTPFNEIPFRIVGSENNDPDIDPAPLQALSDVNIGHYRNSADYEESVYWVGQPTVWFSGLTESWVKETLGGVVTLGSRNAVLLPENGSAGIIQAEPNTIAKEAMDQKEKQMVALGARLVESREVQRTATEARGDKVTENSILGSVAGNVSRAIYECLVFAARFAGAPETEDALKYELNKEFAIAKMTSDERGQLLKEWQAGGITWGEYRARLRHSGIATEDDDDAKATIDEEIRSGPLYEDPNAKPDPAGNLDNV